MPHPHLPLSERDIEHLLQGDVPPGRGDLADLARVFARVRTGAVGEKAPPMSPRLLAELDAAELTSRQAAELRRMLDQRRVQRGRRRWRLAAAAAAVAVIGGITFASMQGPLGDDLRTKPGDDPVSVATPDQGSSSSVSSDDGPSGGVETATPDETTPEFSADDEGTADNHGASQGSGDTVPTTTAVTQPPTTPGGQGSSGDWADVVRECGSDWECWIDVAERECDSVECFAAAAVACEDNFTCRAQLAELCGDTPECWDAMMDSAPRRRHR